MNARRFIVGTLLIAFGGIHLAGEVGWIDRPGRLIAEWWPVAFLFIAAVVVITNPRRWVDALVLAVIGGLMLANTTDAFDIDAELIWPLVLIGIGIAFLAGQRDEKKYLSMKGADEPSTDHTLVDV